MSEHITMHRLGPDDVEAVQMALYLALSWNNDPKIPDIDTAMAHPEVAPYHEGWGRVGDIGVKTMTGDLLVGAAFARLFTEENHGYGYLDDETPELGIGVHESYRRRGLGRQLMNALAEAARAEGIERLSLSVNNPNPSKYLYESLGYTLVEDDGNSSLMVLDL